MAPVKVYFDLPAFLAQASLQYLDLASKVVYFFLQTGHFFSILITLANNICVHNYKLRGK